MERGGIPMDKVMHVFLSCGVEINTLLALAIVFTLSGNWRWKRLFLAVEGVGLGVALVTQAVHCL